MLMILPYGLPTSNQNEQQRFNYNVLTHDVMGKVVLVERYVSPVQAPTHRCD
jgi:hypothetical protein